MTDIKIEDATRKQVAEFLPCALSRAISSYKGFIKVDADIDDSKKYAESQKAGRVAIAHIHLLLKLAEWAELEDSEKLPPDIKKFMEEAQQEVNHYDSSNFIAGVEDNDLA